MKKRQKLPRAKGVTRIDDPGRHGVGWYARVVFRGKTHSKYFADGAHHGTRVAFQKALAWRNAKEKELGKPRTDRLLPSTSTRSRTGISGVYQSKQSFVVAWSPAPGEIRREFVSIREYGRREALRRAIELRRRRERTLYGAAVSRRIARRATGKAVSTQRKTARVSPRRRRRRA
jgi:hypothetical protein